MSITAADVAKLRKMTGVGIMEAKNALSESAGDFEKAVDYLRTRGAAKAAKKADRTTSEGAVHCYTHSNGKIGVVVEVLCETDFVARNEAFQTFCHDLSLHIAAMSPLYVRREDVPADVVAKEKEIIAGQMAQEGSEKPADIMEKIVEGKIGKYFADVCLMEQKFIKDEDLTIKDLFEKQVQGLGENIQMGRFSRIEIGG